MKFWGLQALFLSVDIQNCIGTDAGQYTYINLLFPNVECNILLFFSF